MYSHLKRRQDFPDSFKTSPIMQWIVEILSLKESARAAQDSLVDKTCSYTLGKKTHSHTFYISGKTVKHKWKHLRENFRAELNKMNADKSGNPGLSPSKRESQ
jgi:hypothetical protein